MLINGRIFIRLKTLSNYLAWPAYVPRDTRAFLFFLLFALSAIDLKYGHNFSFSLASNPKSGRKTSNKLSTENYQPVASIIDSNRASP